MSAFAPTWHLEPGKGTHKRAAFGCRPSCQMGGQFTETLGKSSREHSVRDRGVGGSNPLAPTNKSRRKLKGPGSRAFSMYASPCWDVPRGGTRGGEISSQLPISCQSVTEKMTSCREVVRSYSGHMGEVHSGDIGNTFGPKGLSIGSSLQVSSSK